MLQATFILVRTLQLKNVGDAPFTDISKYHKDTQAEIAAAYEAVFTNSGKFAPTATISREIESQQAITFI